MSGEAGFVTVAEAARRLSLSERQVRRYVARLGEGDRQEAASPMGHGPDTATGAGRFANGTGAGRGPVTFRLSALAKAAGKPVEAASPMGHGPDMGRTPDRFANGQNGQGPDTSDALRAALDARAEAEQRAAQADLLRAVAEAVLSQERELTAEVRGERDRLAVALSDAQATARAALAALREEQGRASVLIAAAAQGRFIESATERQQSGNGFTEPMAPSFGTNDGAQSFVPNDGAQERPAAPAGGPEASVNAPKDETPAPVSATGFWARIFKGKGAV